MTDERTKRQISQSDALFNPSHEMIELFVKRTELHIQFVKRNLLMMEGYRGLSITELKDRAENHDRSKFKEPERLSYIWMTWFFYCEKNSIPYEKPDGVDSLVFDGWQHHIHNNWHHPEAHSSCDVMKLLDMVEMICDWTAISQEVTPMVGSCMTWAEKNIDKKWCFSLENKSLLLEIIQELDSRILREKLRK